MLGDQRSEPGHPLHTLRQAATAQAATLAVLDEHVVMGLGPVVTNEDPRHGTS